YVWDSKYSGGQRTGDPQDVVTTHTLKLGRKVAEFHDPQSEHSAAVYVRMEDEGDGATTSQPANGETQQTGM
ncbi:MAG: hypothetical protein ACP5HU_00060, partial [Phycisphaerae bacterium]